MCFSLAWLEQIAIAVIVICVILALLKLLADFVLPRLPGVAQVILGFLIQAGWIIFWGAICIFAVIFIFDLISCLVSYVSIPRLR